MKLAYFDCFSGVSGDMIVGALLDAGFRYEKLEQELHKLKLEEFELKVSKTTKGGYSGTRVKVQPAESHVVRYWTSIRQIIENSALEDQVKERSIEVLYRLASAEAEVHGKAVESVHFHEVGAIDTLVDIVGAVVGLHELGIDSIHCSPIPTGFGLVRTEHGAIPIPAPATAELLKGIPIYSGGVPGELTTPTGAAIMGTLADSFGEQPLMRVDAVGYGAGEREFDTPNLLRIMIGEQVVETPGTRKMVIVSANLDDLVPEFYDYLIERLIAAGAADAWVSNVQMDKGRRGAVVSALIPPERLDDISGVYFKESTTLGVRINEVERREAQRETIEVKVGGRIIRVRAGYLEGRIINVSPEYEDCAQAARATGLPLKDLYHQAREAALRQLGRKARKAPPPQP